MTIRSVTERPRKPFIKRMFINIHSNESKMCFAFLEILIAEIFFDNCEIIDNCKMCKMCVCK